MDPTSRIRDREFKIANGEVVKLTEAEFQNVVGLFRKLSEWDREMLFEAVNGTQIQLKPLSIDDIPRYIGKDLFIAVLVKEDIEGQQWDFYYKLEKVKLDSFSKKKGTLKITNPSKKQIEVIPRAVFIESLSTEQ